MYTLNVWDNGEFYLVELHYNTVFQEWHPLKSHCQEHAEAEALAQYPQAGLVNGIETDLPAWDDPSDYVTTDEDIPF